jgi:asparagine synthase (glutamine-hydrolysing)
MLGVLPRTALRGRAGSLQRFARSAELGMPGAYIDWLSFFSEATRNEALAGASSWAIDDYARIWQESEDAHPLDRLLDLNLRTYLVDDLLVKADRMSMAHGLEVRSPFLDLDLATYALGLAPGLKARGFSLKRVLKAAAADLLPAAITQRRKRGFGVPLDRWFREDLRLYLADMLGSRHARVRAHLRPAVIDRLLHEHACGAKDHGQPLWLLLTLEVFLRREGW